jgi:UDP-N-acetylglucosamine diphosphorylase/glucosamine-1-phosphate N-acetyltransferase
MVIILFDNKARNGLYPFTQTKAVADLRYGIFTPKERWELISGFPAYINTINYLSPLYNGNEIAAPENDFLFIDAALRDADALRSQILSLQTGEALQDEFGLIAGRMTNDLQTFDVIDFQKFFNTISQADNVERLEYAWQLAQWNDEQLRKDFLLLFARSSAQKLSETNKIIQPENIIIEEDAVVEHCIINASAGPVYIGKHATVMEGCMLRGPIAICENATIKMGAKIYGATTVGPYCTVGGEIKNSVLQSFSNKAHDGYLGDAVIGSWCNLGAGTSNSNIKNSAADVLVYNDLTNSSVNAGKKCGVIMGDYTRTAINTSINTGSVFGICCSIFGEGLTPTIINDFSWGMKNASVYEIHKAIEHINNWKKLKGQKLSAEEISVLKYIFDRKQSNNKTKSSKKN